MADLDDFFAKKDRKRSKQAKKHSPDELVKKLEEPRRVETRPRQEGEDASAPPPPQPQQEEDEWREVEVAKKADYTGLKIQHLTPGQENHPSVDGNISGEQNMTNDQKMKGPWNKTQSDMVEVKVEEREPPAPSEVVLPPPPSSKSYVPPTLRNRPPGSMLGPPVRNRYSKLVAPDINNEEFFPTLGGERKPQKVASSGGGSWSEASRGAPASARPPPREVSIGNRYNSLTNDS